MKILTSRKFGTTIMLVLAIAFMSFFNSCKKTSEKAGEKMIEKAIGDGADVDIRGEEVVIETPEGTITSGQTKSWPSEISKDIPAFEFGDILNVVEYDLQGTGSWNIMYENVPEHALDKYKSVLENKDFKIESTIKMGTKGTINASKGDLIVIIMAGEGKASMSVTSK